MSFIALSRSVNTRKFPVELADELSEAFRALRPIAPELIGRYLEILRNPPSKLGKAPRRLPPAAWSNVPRDLDLSLITEIPADVFERIVRLDAAFKRAHRYRKSPGDWLAKAVSGEAIRWEQRRRAAKPRQGRASSATDEIVQHLRKHRYLRLERGEKGGLVASTMRRFQVSRSTVEKAITRLKAKP